MSLVDTIFHYIARGCKGGVRTEGTWHYKADTLYLNITKTVNDEDSTEITGFIKKDIAKYIPIQVDSFLILANVYEDKRYMKKQYKAINKLRNRDLNEQIRGFLHKKLNE